MITVYSTKSCGKCMAVKKILTDKHANFKVEYLDEGAFDVDITRVPTIITEDGFRYEDLDALNYARSL